MTGIGVLVISHGSRNEEWVRLVDEAVAPLAQSLPYPVFSAFLEIVEGRLIQDGIDALERLGVSRIIVVPLFISSGSTHIEEIAWALGVKETCAFESDLEPIRVRAHILMCAPIDSDDECVEIVYEKLKPLSREPSRELVLVVGHGSDLPGFRERWSAVLEAAAEKLRVRGGFAAAEGMLLLPDQVSRQLAHWRSERPELAVLVAPLFVSEGYFTAKVIPGRLEGHDVRYNGRSLLPHPLLTRWMERRIDGAVKEMAMDGQESKTHL